MVEINKLEWITSSFVILVLFLTFASATPEEVGRSTGLNPDDLRELDYFELEGSSFSPDDSVDRPDLSQCGDYFITDSQNISQLEDGTIVPDVEGAWFEMDVEDVDALIVDANKRNVFYEDWIGYYNGLTSYGISGEENYIDTTTNDLGGDITYLNFTFDNADARIFDISSECELRASGEVDVDESFTGISSFPVVSEIANFFGYVVTFFGLIASMFSSMVGLFSVTGDVVSTTLLKVWTGATLIGVLFAVVEIVIELIEAIPVPFAG